MPIKQHGALRDAKRDTVGECRRNAAAFYGMKYLASIFLKEYIQEY